MNTSRSDLFRLLEAALVALFFVQGVRFLYSTLYAHLNSANLVALTVDSAALANQSGVVMPETLQNELLALGAAALLPFLAPLLGRVWFGTLIAAALVAAGRVFMTANGGTLLGVAGASVAVGAALLHMAISLGRHPNIFPPSMALGFAADGLIRLIDHTADLTWQAAYLDLQTALSLGLFICALLAIVFGSLTRQGVTNQATLNFSSALAIGGLFYLEFAVLGLPNAVARRANVEYTFAAPFLAAATLLPTAPLVRAAARGFILMFDGRYRGWVWALTIGLLLTVGFRFEGILAVVALCGAQFMLTLLWWWAVQPSDGKWRFSLAALNLAIAVLVFLAFSGADYLTFEYAFVRGLPEPLGSLLRGLRGLGLLVAVVAVIFAALPLIAARRRVAWRGGAFRQTLGGMALSALGVALALSLPRAFVLQPPLDSTSLRVGTLNLRGGYSLYFGSDLNATAEAIRRSGVDILLLQEVETGRLVSGGVDQVAWLGRTLNMNAVYLPIVEGMQGLAVLSRLPIVQSSSAELSAISKATAVQFVQLRKPNGLPLDIYNAQLSLIFRSDAFSVEQLEADQARQIQEILAFMLLNRSQANALILGGTFNHVPKTDVYLFLSQPPQNFIDPFADFPEERAVTRRLVNEPAVRVDYLWLRNVRPLEVGITPMPFSSHDMPVVKIALN
ncbi:MAG: hypothetical protein D6749_07335 [Chloroflexota bacterium]|nr:MAG: hypothetical protein D6749_07335 [Chloroflexota bacterium]